MLLCFLINWILMETERSQCLCEINKVKEKKNNGIILLGFVEEHQQVVVLHHHQFDYWRGRV
jgi:hypothetical protein